MKNSIWLENYEKEVQGKREQSNQGKKVILVIMPVMLVFIIIAAFVSGGMTDPQAQSGMLSTLGVFAFVMYL